MSTTFEVDGTTYTYTALKVRDSRRVQMILARSFAHLLSDKPDIAGALGSLSEADLDMVTATFGAACTFDDAGGNYRVDKALDKHFSGRPLQYWQWLGECIRAEFADFFAEARKLVASLRGLLPTQTATPSPSPRA